MRRSILAAGYARRPACRFALPLFVASLQLAACSSGAEPADRANGSSQADASVLDAALRADARAPIFDAGHHAVADAASDSGSASDTGPATSIDGSVPTATLTDPGTDAWQLVPKEQVRGLCKLDPDKLAAADTALNTPWAIVRYGRLCHEFKTTGMTPSNAWSTTKTLGALVSGMVAYQTRDIARTGKKTGAFSDEDRADQWLDSVSYNKDAHVAHVLAMVAQNSDLSLGKKTMSYDTIGTTQINTLSTMLNTAIAQDTTRLGSDLEKFTQKFLYGPLGMTKSTWSDGSPNKDFSQSWSTDVLDMARVGLLMLNKGMWQGERLVAADWIYRMTHPAFEDANTGYGYLTWLNASSNYSVGGIPTLFAIGNFPSSPGPCAPVSVYDKHPHGLSDSPDCNYGAPYSCQVKFDEGVWQAVGLLGQVIQGHPGLDMVIIARDLTPTDTGPAAPARLWDAVSPAVIAADPTYPGDTDAFCKAYGASDYAPDLRPW